MRCRIHKNTQRIYVSVSQLFTLYLTSHIQTLTTMTVFLYRVYRVDIFYFCKKYVAQPCTTLQLTLQTAMYFGLRLRVPQIKRQDSEHNSVL